MLDLQNHKVIGKLDPPDTPYLYTEVAEIQVKMSECGYWDLPIDGQDNPIFWEMYQDWIADDSRTV